MKIDSKRAKKWIREMNHCLPGFSEISELEGAEVLVIGAGTMMFYQSQGWVKLRERSTGDIDLSVAISTQEEPYEKVKAILTQNQYRGDPRLKYRYHSPNPLPGRPQYIDLLAHPAKSGLEIPPSLAGVGEEFSFAGFVLAGSTAFTVEKSLRIPHPIAWMNLKRISFLDDPVRRVRDFCDLVEVTIGMVATGNHFHSKDFWETNRTHPELLELSGIWKEIKKQESPRWDLHEGHQEWPLRGYSLEDIEALVETHFREWLEVLEVLEVR